MKIIDCIFTKGNTGFYFDDQKALKHGKIKEDGLFYDGTPLTEGFTSLRIPGESVSINLVLENGIIVTGDCVAVQYSGAAGRDPLFLADNYMDLLEKEIKPLLLKEDISEFRPLSEKYDTLKINGKRLHTAIRYGISQVLLKAVAVYKKMTPAEVIVEEFKTGVKELKAVPIFTQSGDDRYMNADKMIIKQVDSLPHALINNVETKLGLKGERLEKYLKWLKNRIIEKRMDESYNPIIHVDVYGTIGELYNYNIEKIAKYLMKLEKVVSPFKFRVESPIDAPSKEETIKALSDLRIELEKHGSKVEIIADEWCNTLEDIKEFAKHKAGHILQIKTPDLGAIHNAIEAVLYCKKHNIGAYVGGSCNETNISAEISANIAVGTGALLILAKPGMDVDNGFMLMKNEMERIVKLAKRKRV